MFLTKEETNTIQILELIFLITVVKYCTAGQTTDDTQYTTAHALFMPDDYVQETDTN
jgi:hypothetical protein